ncbi:hypothetical protein DCS_06138 [Drechmeria coniospora]|uniref:Uncharacterized protein n=1 Tax=Drechmeria coniospora TaxID=98403 RepID=A0A151GAS7_DRECN|nr:hypothetical protein DCS_06138 [Drechmeria coniospora]KYK54181.1 hypothetical protein DCS_06138 [Drechmeria coniospora]
MLASFFSREQQSSREASAKARTSACLGSLHDITGGSPSPGGTPARCIPEAHRGAYLRRAEASAAGAYRLLSSLAPGHTAHTVGTWVPGGQRERYPVPFRELPPIPPPASSSTRRAHAFETAAITEQAITALPVPSLDVLLPARGEPPSESGTWCAAGTGALLRTRTLSASHDPLIPSFPPPLPACPPARLPAQPGFRCLCIPTSPLPVGLCIHPDSIPRARQLPRRLGRTADADCGCDADRDADEARDDDR